MPLPFSAPHELAFDQVKVLTHAMLAVARVDGVHDAEMRLIREFYEGCSRKGDPRIEDVARGTFDVASARPLFDTPELARLFVKNLILVALADGQFAAAEGELIRAYAAGLGLAPGDVDALHEATVEYLMSGLVHVRNLEALAEIRRSLLPG
jgi:tellurite resistance protein